MLTPLYRHGQPRSLSKIHTLLMVEIFFVFSHHSVS